MTNETPSKKYARFRYWQDVAARYGAVAFSSGKHLVLAGSSGGDIGTLLGFGVSPKNIIAVDHNQEAALAAQEKFPEVHVICGDVRDVAKRRRREFMSAYLDFEVPRTKALADMAMDVITHGLRDGGTIGASFISDAPRTDLGKAFEQMRELEKSTEGMTPRQIIDAFIAWMRGLKEGGSPFPGVQLRSSVSALELDDEAALRMSNSIISYLQIYLSRPEMAMHVDAFIADLMQFERRAVPLQTKFYVYPVTFGSNKAPYVCMFRGEIVRSYPGEKIQAYTRRVSRELALAKSMAVTNCEMDQEELTSFILDLASATRRQEQTDDCFDILPDLFNYPVDDLLALLEPVAYPHLEMPNDASNRDPQKDPTSRALHKLSRRPAGELCTTEVQGLRVRDREGDRSEPELELRHAGALCAPDARADGPQGGRQDP